MQRAFACFPASGGEMPYWTRPIAALVQGKAQKNQICIPFHRFLPLERDKFNNSQRGPDKSYCI